MRKKDERRDDVQQLEQRWFNITASSNANHADIYLYGVVGGWRVNIQRFLDDIRQYKKLKTITVYISTLGGTFMDGLPIYQTLKHHSAHVTTINMGYALSMGSVIMLAGDTRKMGHNCLQMIHSPNITMWDSCNARELRKKADNLDKHEQAIMPRYQEVMGLSAAEVKTRLEDETWYTADEALAAGLIDEITDPVDLGEAEEHATEAHWRETVAMLRNPPPEPFLNTLCQHVPDAKQHFKQAAEPINQPPLPEESEDDNMTPEQLEQLTTDLAAKLGKQQEAAMTAIADKMTEALKPVTEAVEQASTAMQDAVKPLTEVSDKQAETLQAVSDKLDEAKETLTTVKDTLGKIEDLPVNQVRVPEHGNTLAADKAEPVYS